MTPPSPHIRRAAVADIEALIETRVALFQELKEGPAESDLALFQAACRGVLRSAMGGDSCLSWVATSRDEEICGAVILLLLPRLPRPANLDTSEGYILNVYVGPGFRREGIASALLEAVVKEAHDRGLARLRLHATASGHSVYERLGFRGRQDEMELLLRP
jgi:ribosomal protein S18 acetylase RimI-like enzyme